MQETYEFKCCHCHNIQVQGAKVERLNKTGLSIPLQQKVLSNKKTLMQVRTGSVEIDNEQQVSIKKLGENHCSIQCKKCGMVLNLFYGKGNCFAQFSTNKLQEFGIHANEQNQQMIPQTPENVARNFRNVPKQIYSVIKRKPYDGQNCISQSSDEDDYADNSMF